MFTYLALLYSMPSCLCRSGIAHPYLFVHILIPSLYLDLCVQVVDVELLEYLLDITALTLLEAQAFRNTRINIC